MAKSARILITNSANMEKLDQCRKRKSFSVLAEIFCIGRIQAFFYKLVKTFILFFYVIHTIIIHTL